MAEEKQEHRHHLFHHHKDGEQEKPSAEVDHKKVEKHHKHMEQLGALGTVVADAYVLFSPYIELSYVLLVTEQHEKHNAKKDPENDHKHKVKEGIVAAAAVGSAGFAFHERHEKKDAKKQGKE